MGVPVVHDLLRLFALALGGQRDRDTVLIGSPDEDYVLPPVPQVPYGSSRWQISPRHVPDVQRPVGVRQRRGD